MQIGTKHYIILTQLTQKNIKKSKNIILKREEIPQKNILKNIQIVKISLKWKQNFIFQRKK